MRRRTVLRELTALGGVAALAACLDIEDETEVRTGDPANRPQRQHAWSDALRTDDTGNPILPKHHVFLSLSYEGTNRESDREHLEAALKDLERAYAMDHDGLLFTIGYSPTYFERYGETLPKVDLPPAQPILPDENVAIDDADAFLHLASDHASATLGAEEALFGDAKANGTAVIAIDDLFEVDERRTGFWGDGMPSERDDNLQGIPEGEVHEDAPSYMNFRSGFSQSLATEDRVTIQEGRFPEGTTMHVSHIWMTLSEWFAKSTEEQIARMFSPGMSPEAVGPTGEGLTDSNGVHPQDTESLQDIATYQGVVGHAQKMSRFRENGRPPIIRRDVNSDDYGEGGVVFVALQREFEDFRRLRLAMEGLAVAGEGTVDDRINNGILEFIETRSRGNFLIPPRELRALPRGE